MNKRRKSIMVWIIIWAGLLIVVLYSPIGSPDLYSTKNYYVENHSVTFNNNVIQNSPKITPASDNNDNELDIPDISQISKTTYTINNYQSTNNALSQGSSYTVQNQSYQNNNSSGSGGLSGGGNSFIASSGSRNSAASSAIVMTNGITTLSLSTDLSSNSLKQSVVTNYKGGTGGTDPGGDPTGPPIPVGDGWGLLVLFGVCYATFKKRLFIKRQFTFYTTNKKS